MGGARERKWGKDAGSGRRGGRGERDKKVNLLRGTPWFRALLHAPLEMGRRDDSTHPEARLRLSSIAVPAGPRDLCFAAAAVWTQAA
jgi:hypothetical protein